MDIETILCHIRKRYEDPAFNVQRLVTELKCSESYLRELTHLNARQTPTSTVPESKNSNILELADENTSPNSLSEEKEQELFSYIAQESAKYIFQCEHKRPVFIEETN